MARHASNQNNFRLAGWLIALLVAIALVLALVLFLTLRDNTDATSAEPDCVAGDLPLPVAAQDEKVGRSLVDDYAATNPVVRDYCVQPEYVDDVKDAAVYVAPNTSVAHTVLEAAGRTPAVSDPEAVYGETVGVAGEDEIKLADLKADAVRFPVDEEPEASALVASQIAANDNDAVKALTDQRVGNLKDFNAADGFVATTEGNVPKGLKFTPVGADIIYTAIPLNQNEAVSEDQARAGQDFARSASAQFDSQSVNQPVISDLVWAAARPAGGDALGNEAQAAKKDAEEQPKQDNNIAPENTLFLLDTSEAMAPFIEPAADAIGETALALGGAGKEVGLWNYSSPLNPGVVNGYRQNLTVSPDAESVNIAVHRFLVGGVPQTREALQAAAADYGSLDTPTRVVLVTTGTADAGDDAAFADAFRQEAGDKVDVTVVHIGEGASDAAVEQIAKKQFDAPSADKIGSAVKQAAGL